MDDEVKLAVQCKPENMRLFPKQKATEKVAFAWARLIRIFVSGVLPESASR